MTRLKFIQRSAILYLTFNIKINIQHFLNTCAVKPETLIALPFAEKGITSATKLADGTITGPSWGVDSQTIYFSRIGKDGRRALCQIEKDGSREKSLATDGDFSSPKASPQKG